MPVRDLLCNFAGDVSEVHLRGVPAARLRALTFVGKNGKHCASSCELKREKFQKANKMDIVTLSRDSVGLLYHYIFCHWFSQDHKVGM